jgi:ribosomal subunit interface protein
MANINIKATNTKLTDSMVDYVTKKLAVLDDFLRTENKVHVELGFEATHSEGERFSAEVTVLPKPGHYAQARGKDLYEAIDLCVPKIKEQLVRGKDKKVSLRRSEGAARKQGMEAAADTVEVIE